MLGALLALGYAALFLFLIQRWEFFQLAGVGKRLVMGFFLLKLAFATLLWYIYTYHYSDRATADIYKYFDSSAVMFGALPDHPLDFLKMLLGIRNDTPYFSETYYKVMDHWSRKYESNLYNDSHTMIRFNALVRLFSFGHFHVHNVFAVFLSFTGLAAIHRALAPSLRGREKMLAFALFIIPSVLFWASGVIKESLLFFGLGMMLWNLFRWMDGRITMAGVIGLLSSIVLLFFLKFYVLLSMFPALVALVICRRWPGGALKKYMLVVGVILVAALTAHHVVKGFDILNILWWKQKDFIGLATSVNSGSFVMPPTLEPTFWSFLKHAPYAFLSTLIGPILHPGSGVLGLVSATENIILITLLAVMLRFRRRVIDVDMPLLLFCVTYVTLLALVIGYTTPVMGAVVRYRTPLLPFLMIIGLCIVDENRVFKRWPGLRTLLS